MIPILIAFKSNKSELAAKRRDIIMDVQQLIQLKTKGESNGSCSSILGSSPNHTINFDWQLVHFNLHKLSFGQNGLPVKANITPHYA